MFVSITFIATLIRFGDKLCHIKSMWVADEKLIINKLGPYYYTKFILKKAEEVRDEDGMIKTFT